ncbi:MAG: glucokinase [Rhizomicrobium sp.]
MNRYALVADAGGTNIRFALVDLDDTAGVILRAPRKCVSRNFAGVEDAVRSYLTDQGQKAPPSLAVFSVAGPVRDNAINMTNLGWNFSGEKLSAASNIAQVRLINDYEAIARSVPRLSKDDLREIGPRIDAKQGDHETVAIVGPGTGLGVGGYVRSKTEMIPLVSEGGHAGFSPADDVEIAVLQYLRGKFGHVSNERMLSGPGLVNLHEALSAVEGAAFEHLGPHDITAQALANPNAHCGRVLSRFCAILGAVAGDVALIFGARDGVMLAGGILPAVADFLEQSDFRAGFEAKGRFENYMKAIPTRLIVNDNAGLLGAATLACTMAGGHARRR